MYSSTATQQQPVFLSLCASLAFACQNGDLNQYWYSQATIEAIAGMICSSTPDGALVHRVVNDVPGSKEYTPGGEVRFKKGSMPPTQ